MVDTLEKDEEQFKPATEEGEDKAFPPEISNASAEERDIRDKENSSNEIAKFLKKHNPQPPVRGRKDALHDRYLVKHNESLPELNAPLAAACVATDDNLRERELYALICDRSLPYRLKNMQELEGFDHPNIIPLVAAGSVEFTHDDQVRMVAVYERPRGRKLSELLRERKGAFSEGFLIDDVIAPLCDVLRTFQERGICHGNINLDTVYYSDRIQLGECVSEPAGYSQQYYFEPTERAQAMPFGKGETTIGTDCYSLGILVLHLMFGYRHFERIDEREYMIRRLSLGSYNILVGAKEFKGMEDFLKGVLNDDPEERWTPVQIEQWVKGKKYNLLTPSVLREAQRPFMFNEEDYYNRRALAHALMENWEESKNALRTTHLSRWVEVSLHKNEMADSIRRVMEKTGGIHAISEKANNEMVARTICLLDPEGPVRYNMISAFVDGLGVVLADAFRTTNQKMIQSVIEVLDYNFYNYINDLLDGAKNKRYGTLLWKMQNCSRYLRMQAMGFGIERILYELNPTLPCQSPLLATENVLTAEEMLGALDRMGTRKSKGFDYLDRHIAAFLATRMDLNKELKLKEIALLPALAQNPQLIVLNMLAQVQRKAGRPKLKGLSAWAALRIVPLVDNFHSRTVRRKIRAGLRDASRTGDLDKIFELLKDQNLITEDYTGFQKAVGRFTRNAKKISQFENRRRLRSKSEQLGTILAMIVAYSMLLVSIGMVVKEFLYF